MFYRSFQLLVWGMPNTLYTNKRPSKSRFPLHDFPSCQRNASQGLQLFEKLVSSDQTQVSKCTSYYKVFIKNILVIHVIHTYSYSVAIKLSLKGMLPCWRVPTWKKCWRVLLGKKGWSTGIQVHENGGKPFNIGQFLFSYKEEDLLVPLNKSSLHYI